MAASHIRCRTCRMLWRAGFVLVAFPRLFFFFWVGGEPLPFDIEPFCDVLCRFFCFPFNCIILPKRIEATLFSLSAHPVAVGYAGDSMSLYLVLFLGFGPVVLSRAQSYLCPWFICSLAYPGLLSLSPSFFDPSGFPLLPLFRSCGLL